MGKEFYNADRKSLKNTLITIPHIDIESDSIAPSRTTCGRCLCSLAIISESMNRVSCQITTRAIIAPSTRRKTPAIAERLLDTVYSTIKIAGLAKFKVGDSVRVSKYKMIEKRYMPNWTTEVFIIIKAQRINPETYLLEDYRRKPIAGGFYEFELHRINPDVSRRESTAQEERQGVRQVVRI